MRNFLRINLIAVFTFFAAITVFSQNITPLGFNYQAIARDANGNPITNQNLVVRISVLNTPGTLKWQESHSVFTNEYGLFNLVIGEGTTTGFGTLSSFQQIDWSDSDYYIRIDCDFSNGLLNMGTVKLQSVPYAKIADSARVAPKFNLEELLDVDLTGLSTNLILQWNGTNWVPTTITGASIFGGKYITVNLDTINLDTAMSGDLDGFYPDPVVVGLNGFPLNIAGINPGDVLEFSGTDWVAGSASSANITGGSFIIVTNDTIHLDSLMSGDLDGFYPDPTVSGILGIPINPVSLGADKILKFDGAQWIFANDSIGGGSSATFTGGSYIFVDTINNIISLDTLMGGDLDGFYNDPTVIGLLGIPIDPSSFGPNKILKFDGIAWVFADDSSEVYTGGSYINVDPASNEISLDTTMGGDLQGFFPNPEVAGILGNPIATTTPINGDVLFWDALSQSWVPAGPGGDVNGTYDAMLVTGLRGRNLSPIAPTNGQILIWENATTTWKPTTFAPNSLEDADTDTRVEVESTPDDDFVRIITNGSERLSVNPDGSVGVNTTAPASLMEVNGSFAKSVFVTSNSILLDISHSNILANNASGTVTISLPSAGTCKGRIYTIKRISTGNVEINPNGAETIDGVSANYILGNTYDFITIVSDGDNWYIIAKN